MTKTLIRGSVFLVCILLTGESFSFAGGACAHRGDSSDAPENTVPAILSAVKKGAHQIEIDVQLSKDGKLVIMHDGTVDRTTDGSGKVADMDMKELRTLDAGGWFDSKFNGTQIPTLEEALELIPHNILCNVHVKGGPETTVPVAEVIASMGHLDHCFITLGGSQAHKAFAAARAVIPDIMLCTGVMADKVVRHDAFTISQEACEEYMGKYQRQTINPRIDFIQLYYWDTPVPYERIGESVKFLRQNGIRVNYCCAHIEEVIKPLIEAGVDYILTDDIDICLSVLKKYGVKPVVPSQP